MMPSDIVRQIAAKHSTNIAELRGRLTDAHLVMARAEAAHALRAHYPKMSNGWIGQQLGRTSWQVRYYLNDEWRVRRQALSRAFMDRRREQRRAA
jgi:hypothetical protein